MLGPIAAFMLIVWALGLMSSNTLGGFIHLLLVIAIALSFVGFLSRRQAA
jgi:hypothetical protein